MAQKDERPYGTKLKALLLLIISLISFGFGMSVLTGTISSWLFVIAEILLVLIMSIPILFIPTLVEGFLFIHEFLRLRLFHSILDQEEPSISQVIIVSVLLNFSFFTLAYTTSLRESIIAVIPVLASVRMMLPSSAIDLFQTLARISLENVGLLFCSCISVLSSRTIFGSWREMGKTEAGGTTYKAIRVPSDPCLSVGDLACVFHYPWGTAIRSIARCLCELIDHDSPAWDYRRNWSYSYGYAGGTRAI